MDVCSFFRFFISLLYLVLLCAHDNRLFVACWRLRHSESSVMWGITFKLRFYDGTDGRMRGCVDAGDGNQREGAIVVRFRKRATVFVSASESGVVTKIARRRNVQGRRRMFSSLSSINSRGFRGRYYQPEV